VNIVKHDHGRPQKFFQGRKVDIVLIFFWLLATQRKVTYTKKKNVQCYVNSCMQCFPCTKTWHWANVLVSMDFLRLS